MLTFLTVLYVIDCLFLILVVLLQAGKGGGLGALSGGSTQSVFGGAGAANFMTRLTMVVAALFMILSGTLAYLSSSGQRALDDAAGRAQAIEEARALGVGDSTGVGEAEAAGQSLAGDPLAADAGATPTTVDAGATGMLDVVDEALGALEGEPVEEAEAPEVETPEVADPAPEPKAKPKKKPAAAAKPEPKAAETKPEPKAAEPKAAEPKPEPKAADVKAPAPLEAQ